MMLQGVIAPPRVDAAIGRLMSGDVFTALAVEEAVQRAAELEAVLEAVSDPGTRVVWVGNPLRSPLTIERFLIQIVGPELDLRIERGPRELATLLARRQEAENRLLIVVQQPETINPETIDLLGAMAGHLGAEAVTLQFLFVGSPALRLPTVAAAESRPAPPPRQAPPPPPPSPPPGPAPEPAPFGTAFEAGDWSVGIVPPRRNVLPFLVLLLAAFLGTVLFLLPPARQGAVPRAKAMAADPPRIALGDPEALHQRFDKFLDDPSAAAPAASEVQENARFGELPTRRRSE